MAVRRETLQINRKSHKQLEESFTTVFHHMENPQSIFFVVQLSPVLQTVPIRFCHRLFRGAFEEEA
jgi:hypothetical protein